ncbi:MAG: c-type cytochrome [Betaproteobacteria bacterium]|nr:c-type cytochrome [Betaproteobacteria bacterium]
MKRLTLVITLSAALLGCPAQDQGPAKAAFAPLSASELAAGRAIAERDCKGCHGVDGRGAAPGIPHVAAQRGRYLVAALEEYRGGKRTHAALREIATHLSAADARNVAGFYASLPPLQSASPAAQGAYASPYEQGKKVAAACAKCHGEDGNSTAPGIPSLAGQQPQYLVVAIQEYLLNERKAAPMHALLPRLGKLDTETLALYFASQVPAPRGAPPFGDPAAGEPLSAVCGGCHGGHGVSTDSATPSLAAQDARYLVDAIKAYRTTRKRENMRLYVTGLSDKDIENIAAFYAVQKSRAAEKGQTLVKDLTDRCERCHAADVDIPGMVVPKIHGQDRDYLVMALRAYRDDRRESSMMHKMSLPYSDSIIESLATAYASQPAR